MIDEVQRRPDLFPMLRVLADRRRNPARFLILGSASGELMRQSAETLAGRLEAYASAVDVPDCWFGVGISGALSVQHAGTGTSPPGSQTRNSSTQVSAGISRMIIRLRTMPRPSEEAVTTGRKAATATVLLMVSVRKTSTRVIANTKGCIGMLIAVSRLSRSDGDRMPRLFLPAVRVCRYLLAGRPAGYVRN